MVKTEGIITKKDIRKRVDDNPPIVVELNLATYRCLLNLDKGYSIKFGKEFGKLIGFEPGEYKDRNVGTKSPNITNPLDYIYIHCHLTSDSIVDGKYGGVPTADKERSWSFIIEPRRISYHLINTPVIESIRIYITDLLGRIVNLNNVHTSFDLKIKKYRRLRLF